MHEHLCYKNINNPEVMRDLSYNYGRNWFAEIVNDFLARHFRFRGEQSERGNIKEAGKQEITSPSF